MEIGKKGTLIVVWWITSVVCQCSKVLISVEKRAGEQVAITIVSVRCEAQVVGTGRELEERAVCQMEGTEHRDRHQWRV